MESLPPLPELPENKNIPSYFFDGFELQMNNSVIRLVLKLGHERTMTLRFAYVTGKTLADGLNDLFSTLQEVTGNPTLTSSEMDVVLQKAVALLSERRGVVIEKASD